MNHASEPGTHKTTARPIDTLLGFEGPEFIRQAYRVLLGREVDPGGMVAYLNRLEAGLDRAELIDELRLSEEGRRHSGRMPGQAETATRAMPMSLEELLEFNGPPFVKAAYQLLLGRPADPSGLAHYLGRIQGGVARTQVLAEIASSEEYSRRGSAVPGVERLLAEHRRHPLLAAASRLIRPLRGRATPLVPSQPASPAVQSPEPSPDRPQSTMSFGASGCARPAYPARALMLTLPTLEDRHKRDAA